MAILVDALSADCNQGERRLITAMTGYLDDTYTIYHNRVISGREMDVCVLIPGIGVLVVEVKGWQESTIDKVLDGHRISIFTENGTDIQTPRKQARGYRHLLEQRIRRDVGAYPLVFEMVAYPFVSASAFISTGMQAVTEEAFTFLKEDMETPQALRSKLDRAISLAGVWQRDHFGQALENQVKSLFEPDFCERASTIGPAIAVTIALVPSTSSWLVPTYSKLCYIAENDEQRMQTVDELLHDYSQGTKVFLLTSCTKLLKYAGAGLTRLLKNKDLQWKNKRLSSCIDEFEAPVHWVSGGSFSCFNFEAIHCQPGHEIQEWPSFSCTDGGCIDGQLEQRLKELQANTAFNLDQYLVEHAACDKHLLVRAGAGTGKTHVMISRIVFLCYKEAIYARGLLQRIVMITFTNEATENMKRRLKKCFLEYYLLTDNPGFLDMVGHVDGMKISTIDSYARGVIEAVCSSLGLGHEIRITSGVMPRREAMEGLLEQFVEGKRTRNPRYLSQLGMPVYELRGHLHDIVDKLNNKNVSITSLEAADFGQPLQGEDNECFHEIVSTLIPQAEAEMNEKLKDKNTVHLSLMMSTLRDAVAEGAQQLLSMKDSSSQYLFIDEFQDTDDVQISALLAIAQSCDSRLFVVGDIKQCIFRFRGADEQAFSLLKIENARNQWFSAVLNQNYRTDSKLLTSYAHSFARWNQQGLLRYEHGERALTSRLDLNSERPAKDFYRRLSSSRNGRLDVLISEIRHCQQQIAALKERGVQLSTEECTIAILVRENWQAEEVRLKALEEDLQIETHQGGDLFQSAPALDLLTLVQALLNNQQPRNLYALLTSNFFGIPLSKKILYDLRYTRTVGSPRKRQVEYLSSTIDQALHQAMNDKKIKWSWQKLLERFRTEPVLQVLRELYQILRPWERYSTNQRSQHFYAINVDSVFEHMMGALHVVSLTLNSLADYLQMCVVTGMEVDCRWPEESDTGVRIKCITVHKAKGLEYGFVIVPYADFAIHKLKDNRLDVTYIDGKVGYRLKETENNRVIGTANYSESTEVEQRLREETRNLYVAMTRAIRSFSWIHVSDSRAQQSWQVLLEGDSNHGI